MIELNNFEKFFEGVQDDDQQNTDNKQDSNDQIDDQQNTNPNDDSDESDDKSGNGNQMKIPFAETEEEDDENQNTKKYVQKLEDETSDDNTPIENTETPENDLGELTISDDRIDIGDYVVCVNREGLGPKALAFLNSKVYYKVFNITDTGKLDLGTDIVFTQPRFKKVELTSDVKVGDIVVVRDKNQKNLPSDIFQYLLSKPYFEVLASKETKGTISLDIGFKSQDGKPYLFNVNRFLSSKKLSEKNKEKYADDKIFIQEYIDHPFIEPMKLEIVNIKNIEDVSVNFESMSLRWKGKKEMSMNIKKFLTYYKPLSREHQKAVDKKMREIDVEKREDIDNLIKKYDNIYRFYRNISELIKKTE